MSVFRPIWIAFALGFAPESFAQNAARVGDLGQHAGSIIVSGSPNVLINGLAAAIQTSVTTCPQICPLPPTTPTPHVGGSVATGSASVRIGGLSAARVGDVIVEPTIAGLCANVHPIVSGSANVLIGP